MEQYDKCFSWSLLLFRFDFGSVVVSYRVSGCILQQSEEQYGSNLHIQRLATGGIIIFIPNILFYTVQLFVFKMIFYHIFIFVLLQFILVCVRQTHETGTWAPEAMTKVITESKS